MNRRKFPFVDWSLLIPVAIPVTISLITLSFIGESFFKNQLFFLTISILAFVFFSQLNYQVLRMYSLPIYLISIILFVLIFIIGIESRGAVRWIDFFGLKIQFSEVLRPFLALSFASFFVERRKLDFSSLISIFLLLLPIAGLIFLQPDLGDTLIYIGVVFFTLIYVGYPLRYFILSFLPFLFAFPFFWNFLHDYQKQRILTFLNPGNDPLGTSYNAIQSVIAVGSGMFLGKGLGQGTQSGLRFLPERQTDFIFASISEQLGFIGAVILLAAFAFLIYRIYKIFLTADDEFVKIFSVITFFSFSLQIFINIGMNIGIIPIVGVTLPFVSYGGSSLLSNFIFLGLLSSVSRFSKDTEVLEIR
jgi:rod shape determining protein RodA